MLVFRRYRRLEPAAIRLRTAALVTVFLLLAACSADESAPATDATLEPTAAAAAATPEPTAEPDPTDDAATGEVCRSDDPPDLASGWTFLRGGDATFGIAYPDDWEDLSGVADFNTATLIDEETLEELSLPEDAEIEVDFVRSPEEIPNLSIFRLGEVDSTTEEIADREAEGYAELDDLERIVDDSIEECLGGTPAVGFSLEAATSDGFRFYQQNLFAVRDGELYLVQWLDELDPDLELLDEILATWGWIAGSEEPSGSGGIAEAAMATEVDESLDDPDPSTFTTSFTTDAPAIYVVYKPDSGAVGTVDITWLIDGEVEFESTFDVDENTSWAYGGITPASGGFAPGDYEVRLELNGDEETLEFTVEASP
ncbi:MAG: hypothetical protein ABI841_01305 [Chloroflexota bacterium]